jgi:methionyl-tRNA formyltransferase
MRVVFMGTPEFAVPILASLIRSEHQVVAVYTQPDKPAGRGQRLVPSAVKRLALEYRLPILQPLSLRQPQEVEKLATLKPEIIVVAAFGQLLPQSILDIPPLGCINVHPSLLPQHRGPSPITAAILAGDEVTGVSIMLMDRGFDTGPILAQSQIAISPQDTAGSLRDKLAQLGAQLLMQTLPLWLGGCLAPQPQDEQRATYSRLITKEEGGMDWHLSAVQLERRVRAFQPWPGCYTRWHGKVLKIIEALPSPGEQQTDIGRVLAMKPSCGACVGVQTGEGILGFLRVQLEGRRAMAIEEFLRGQRGFVGALLPG